MHCPNCQHDVPAHVERCIACGFDVGFPNVRAAETEAEKDSLSRRLASARTSADARGALSRLNDFGRNVLKSNIVLARSLGVLDAFVKDKNFLYVSFQSQVRAGARVPENNDWDRGRDAAEATIHPNYSHNIIYSALSLDGFGVLWWGDYSITIKELHISKRTSVFEENPFVFCERYRVAAGRAVPAGFRANWAERNQLAMAKLVDRISVTTQPKDYPSILLNQSSSREDADFIECNTYGGLHSSSIERVVGVRPRAKPDLIIWKSVVSALRKAGVIVEEV
jgi:hypothetical protein